MKKVLLIGVSVLIAVLVTGYSSAAEMGSGGMIKQDQMMNNMMVMTVNSTNPSSGAEFVYRQKGQTAWLGGIIPMMASFTMGSQLEIAIPFVAYATGRNIMTSLSGCDSVSYWSDDPSISNTAICSMTMGSDKGVSVQYSSVTMGTPPVTPSMFWQSKATGQMVEWSMDGTTNTVQTSLPTPPTGWEVVGIRDINKDGKPDLLMFNQSTGDIYVYYLEGGTILGGQAGGKVLGNEWNIVGFTDIDGDGSPDYLWQHQTTGELYAWLLGFDDWHGIVVKQGVEVNSGGVPLDPTIWKMVGTGDFNGDGKPVLLWQNQANGDLEMWYMNGTAVIGQVSIIGKGDLNWKVVGVGDYNKDGKPDILWRNQSTGQNEVWFMNGASKTGSVSLSSVDTSWDIVGPK